MTSPKERLSGRKRKQVTPDAQETVSFTAMPSDILRMICGYLCYAEQDKMNHLSKFFHDEIRPFSSAYGRVLSLKGDKIDLVQLKSVLRQRRPAYSMEETKTKRTRLAPGMISIRQCPNLQPSKEVFDALFSSGADNIEYENASGLVLPEKIMSATSYDHVKTLRFGMAILTNEHIKELVANLSGLENVTITATPKLTGSAFRELGKLPHLKQLKFGNPVVANSANGHFLLDIKDVDVTEFLKTAKQIEDLSMYGFAITPGIFPIIAEHGKMLKRLSIDSGELLSSVYNLPPVGMTKHSLNMLTISNINTDTNVLMKILRMFEIESFVLGINVFFRDYLPNTPLPEAKELWEDLTNTRIPDVSISCYLPHIDTFIKMLRPRRLIIKDLPSGVTSISSINKIITEAENLSFLHLYHKEIKAEHLSTIAKYHPNLETLKLESCSLLKIPVLPSNVFPRLQNFHLIDCGAPTMVDLLRIGMAARNMVQVCLEITPYEFRKAMIATGEEFKNYVKTIADQSINIVDTMEIHHAVQFRQVSHWLGGFFSLSQLDKATTEKLLSEIENQGFAYINRFLMTNHRKKSTMSRETLAKMAVFAEDKSPVLGPVASLAMFLICPSLKRLFARGHHCLTMNLVEYLQSLCRGDELKLLRSSFRDYIFPRESGEEKKIGITLNETSVEKIATMFRKYYVARSHLHDWIENPPSLRSNNPRILADNNPFNAIAKFITRT